MSDYKYEMQLLAEQAAEEKFDKDFSQLSAKQQSDLFSKAMEKWIDNLIARAETLEDR